MTNKNSGRFRKSSLESFQFIILDLNEEEMPENYMDKVTKTVLIPDTQKKIKSIADVTKQKIDTTNATEVEYIPDSNKIQVPATMTKLQASWNLLTQFEQEETYRDFSRSYPYRFINDFLPSVFGLIKQEFGNIIVKPGTTPTEIAIPMRYEGDKLISEQAFLGEVVIDSWDGATIKIGMNQLIVNAKLKFEKKIKVFLDKVEQLLSTTSNVRGAAVEIIQTPFGVLTRPVRVSINKGIFLEEGVERLIAHLIIPSLNDGEKKVILFTGDFGTGKTETAIRVGVEGQKQFNRTFFYLKNAALFSALLPYLNNYQQCTVFIEDIDQVTAGERDVVLNNLLNSLDGAELKKVDVTIIFTTNSPDSINPAMRRPGRIDEVIQFGFANKQTIEAIYRYNLKDLPGSDNVDYLLATEKSLEVSKELQGAIITEIAKRAAKYIDKFHGGVANTEALLDAIASMKQHIDFMRKPQTPENNLGRALGKVYDTMQENSTY